MVGEGREGKESRDSSRESRNKYEKTAQMRGGQQRKQRSIYGQNLFENPKSSETCNAFCLKFEFDCWAFLSMVRFLAGATTYSP